MYNSTKTNARYILIGIVVGVALSSLFQNIGFEHCVKFSSNHNSARIPETLTKKLNILCWVLTNPKNHKVRAIHIKNTWGKRCDTLLFISSEYDSELPTIAFPLKEGKSYNWGKIKEGFKYAYENHFENTDWFFKVDDDAYVVMENLRYMLKDRDPSEPIWFGALFNSFVTHGWHSGGPGFVLSKEAVRRFVEDGISNKSVCRTDNGGGNNKDDVEIGHCLQKVGVFPGDSRDALGRQRFLPLPLEKHLIPGGISGIYDWYWRWNPYPRKEGIECCSENAVSFHYTQPRQMYVLEYLIYHLKPYEIYSKN